MSMTIHLATLSGEVKVIQFESLPSMTWKEFQRVYLPCPVELVDTEGNPIDPNHLLPETKCVFYEKSISKKQAPFA